MSGGAVRGLRAVAMHLILTHEQADFDALAALFGAWRLEERGVAVLPRKMNRNTRAFSTLYGADLPFTDQRDLPEEPIESVLLVDTQSLLTLKGINRRTPVRVVDHHPAREATPKGWAMTLVETGATTTHFVERLQEEDEPLTVIQATLMLLGIYEDTGSLTYSHTTARDARAAAWLLEAGASLQLAAPYLNPPLSEDQRSAYHLLLNSAETRELEGLRVVTARAELPGTLDEISSLAHKLRDLFDPDALFVLVQTTDGVRIVARSSTDRLDVAAVVTHFGGGGHERAAAALVRQDSQMRSGLKPAGQGFLDRTMAELLAILPEHIRPVATVGQLMSRRPRTLKPDTPAQEAAKLMQKYGYEGFPVVQGGHVVGLLTRRAVDRAINHRLNLNASSLMEAGDIGVKASDTLERLQTVMSSSGWGQVPVTDDNGRVIGIVTRTDLLKVLAPPAMGGGRVMLQERLQTQLPPAQLSLLHAIESSATELHLPIYIVGGFVRDFLLGRTSLDFDIVVEGDAIALAHRLASAYGGSVTEHGRFGTAKWRLGASVLARMQIAPKERSELPGFIDLITARLEFYEHPAALPGVEHASIRHDLHRRDFTINTLALRLDGHHFGELHDYYGGYSDLKRGLVRVLHSLSFVDDPTRMLRAVRYEQRYGFQIDSRTVQLMDDARPLIARLSNERIRHELDLTLDESAASGMLSRMYDLGLLGAILRELPWSPQLASRMERSLDAPTPLDWEISQPAPTVSLRRALGYAVWLQDLGNDELEVVQGRLGFPATLLRVLRASRDLKADLPRLAGSSPSIWTSRLDGVPRLSIYAVFLGIKGSDTGEGAESALEAYALRWRHTHSATNGDSLRSLGLPPGPRYQIILERLRAAWLDGEVTSDEQETALLTDLLSAEVPNRARGN